MISPHAIIEPGAKIAEDVSVGHFSVIGKDVEIGAGSKIGSNVVIQGLTKIGKHNQIYPFASLGLDCQDKKYHGEPTTLEIGDYNIFREGCTVHRGTALGNYCTKIGSHNLFMVNTHVAHDCVVGDYVVFSNGASIAGHVNVEDYVNLSGFVGVNQFCRIGAYSFAAGGSIIIKDVLPFTIVAGHPAKQCGVNVIGLERNHFEVNTIVNVKKAYKIILKHSNTVAEAVDQLRNLVSVCPEIKRFIDFMQNSQRGIIR